MLHVKFCRLARMVIRMLRMSVSRVCVVSSCFVIARLVVLSGVAMMLRRACVALGCLVMVLGCLFRHVFSESQLFDPACCTLVLFCYFRMKKT